MSRQSRLIPPDPDAEFSRDEMPSHPMGIANDTRGSEAPAYGYKWRDGIIRLTPEFPGQPRYYDPIEDARPGALVASIGRVQRGGADEETLTVTIDGALLVELDVARLGKTPPGHSYGAAVRAALARIVEAINTSQERAGE